MTALNLQSSTSLAITSCKNSSRTGQTNSMSSKRAHTAQAQTSSQTLSNDSVTLDSLVTTNPFFNDFVDCIENLPNRLQLLLTELRNVDVLVKARHRKLQLIKQEIESRQNEATSLVESTGGESFYKNLSMQQLFVKLHQLLVQCQTLGDQKVRLTSQIIETIGNKTRQLGLDTKSNEAKFNIEIDEEKILSDFKSAIKKNRSIQHVHHHYSGSSGAGASNGRGSTTRNCNTNGGQNAKLNKQLNSIELNKSKNRNGLVNGKNSDLYSFDESSNLSNSPFNTNSSVSTSQTFRKSFKNLNFNPFNSSNKSKKNLRVNSSSSLINNTNTTNNNNTNLNNNNNSNTNSKNSNNNLNSLDSNVNSLNGKRSVKKIKLEVTCNPNETTQNVKNQSESSTNQLTVTRSKRQLNYNIATSTTSNTLSSKLNKKRRLSQLKSSSHSLSHTNQCKSPSSLSTASSTASSSYVLHSSNKTSTRPNTYLTSNTKQAQSLKQQQQKENIKLTNSTSNSSNNSNKKEKSLKRLSNQGKKSKKNLLTKNKIENSKLTKSNRIDNAEDDGDDEEDEEEENYSNIDEYDSEEQNSNVSNSASEEDTQTEPDDAIDSQPQQMTEDNLNEKENEQNNLEIRPESSNFKMEQEEEKILKENSSDENNSNETESINHIDEDGEQDQQTFTENSTRASKKIKQEPEVSNEEEANSNTNKKKSNRKINGQNQHTETLVQATATAAEAPKNLLKSNSAPDEPVYCLCRDISYGQMILCDNDACNIEWFHFNCVKLASKPKGKWYCPQCRGDTHKVMKKMHSSSLAHSSPSFFNSYHSSYSNRTK